MPTPAGAIPAYTRVPPRSPVGSRATTGWPSSTCRRRRSRKEMLVNITDVLGRVLDHDEGAGLRLHRSRFPAAGDARRASSPAFRPASAPSGSPPTRWTASTACTPATASTRGDDADRRRPQRQPVVQLRRPVQPAARAPGAALELGQAGDGARHRPERGDRRADDHARRAHRPDVADRRRGGARRGRCRKSVIAIDPRGSRAADRSDGGRREAHDDSAIRPSGRSGRQHDARSSSGQSVRRPRAAATSTSTAVDRTRATTFTVVETIMGQKRTLTAVPRP